MYGFVLDCNYPYDEEKGAFTTYEITNPVNEELDYYLATANGTYTFTIKDLLTNETYTESVVINSINGEVQYEVQKNRTDRIYLGLQDKTTEEFTTIDKAYVMYYDSKIDVTSRKSTDGGDFFNAHEGFYAIKDSGVELAWNDQRFFLCVFENSGIEYIKFAWFCEREVS